MTDKPENMNQIELAAKQGPAVVAETTNRLKIEALEKSLADLTARVFAIEEAATRPA